MKDFLKRLKSKVSRHKITPRPDLRQTGSHIRQTGVLANKTAAKNEQAIPPGQPKNVEIDPHVDGRIEDCGPGKNVLIRNMYVREDAGTHEKLKLVDDSLLETDEETGIDPYNTGQFDRSKNWDKRFRK